MTREENTISRVTYRLGQSEVRKAILEYAATQTHGTFSVQFSTNIEICDDETAIITTEHSVIKEPQQFIVRPRRDVEY